MSLSRHPVKGERRVIFLDAAGTLFHLAKSVGETYANFARRFGANTSPERMDAAFRSAWRAQPRRAPIPRPRKDDDRPWWNNLALSTLQTGADLPGNFPADEWFTAVYQYYASPNAWVLYAEVESALTRLGSDTRLAVISNFDGRLRGILSGLGISHHFEHVFISSEIGADKPDREIFDHAIRVMGAQACDCWHVGDDPERDWTGASAAGLRAFRLERPEATLAEFLP